MDITESFICIIRSFVEEFIPAEQFEREFIETRREALLKGYKYDVTLEDLFFDIDAFCSDPNLFENGDIDEIVLLERCKQMLKLLG